MLMLYMSLFHVLDYCKLLSFVDTSYLVAELLKNHFLTYHSSFLFVSRPTLKNCWFAVYRPTHQFAPYPIFFFAIFKKKFVFASIYNCFA